MLTVEEIKQAVEFADGFEYIKGSGLNAIICGRFATFPTTDINLGTLSGILWEGVYYDLFLDRVNQGMNRETEILITLDDDELSIMIGMIASTTLKHNGTTEGIREAREKAIQFVLSGSDHVQ